MNKCTFGKSFCYIALAFFVTASDLYAFAPTSLDLARAQEPLNLNLPKKSRYIQFGPNENLPSSPKVRTQGEMLTVDTQDQSVCEQIRDQLVNDIGVRSKDTERENFCDSSKGRYVHVLRFDPEKERPAIFSEDTETNMREKVKDFTVIGVGMMALIAAMPKSVSKWEDGALNNPLNKWRHNVSRAPVVDKDDWQVNYIGHPYSGGAYYVVARKAGYSPMESFGFSAVMSTFWWEYGLEAFAERPSIQDLLITPIIGSLFGEAMFQWNKKIEADGGKILGSKFLGTIGLVLTDPAGSIMRGINRLTRNRFIYSSKIDFGVVPFPRNYMDPTAQQKYQLGLQLRMRFWGL